MHQEAETGESRRNQPPNLSQRHFRRQLTDAFAIHQPNQAGKARDVHLTHSFAAMLLYRLDADSQLNSDRFIGRSVINQPNDFLLAI